MQVRFQLFESDGYRVQHHPMPMSYGRNYFKHMDPESKSLILHLT